MILVTGGTGLIGSQLLFDLASSGESIRAIRRKSSDMLSVNRLFSDHPDLYNRIEWVEGDVLDIYSLENAMNGVDAIYHAAAFISFHPKERSKMMKVNVGGTANMVNTALDKNIKRFCHFSSVATLGPVAAGELINEQSWWKTSNQNSNYAISKYGSEREVWRAVEEGLNAFILNPSIVIGPGDWKSGSSQMFSQVWKGLPFYTNGCTGFVDVRDVSKAAIVLMNKGVCGERYIVNSENITYRHVFNLIAECLGKPKAYIYVSPFLGKLGWRLERLKAILTGSRPMITRETTRSGMTKRHFSNEKIRQATGMDFISVADSVKHASQYFLLEREGFNR